MIDSENRLAHVKLFPTPVTDLVKVKLLSKEAAKGESHQPGKK